jgi:hypothetical protein
MEGMSKGFICFSSEWEENVSTGESFSEIQITVLQLMTPPMPRRCPEQVLLRELI